MKCRRPNCKRKAGHGGRNRGLCEAHYNRVPRGYVDARKSSEHLKELNQVGFSWRQLAELTGLTQPGLHGVRTGKRVQVGTEKRILAVPLPVSVFAGRGRVDAVGSQRRIRALMAMGWTMRALEDRLEIPHRRLSTVIMRPQLYTALARKIAVLYDELSMTAGPSNRTRSIARKRGWAPPLSYDDIDDPLEQPDLGVHEPVTWIEKYQELRDLGVPESRIPERMGVDRKSVERQLMRLGITKGAA